MYAGYGKPEMMYTGVLYPHHGLRDMSGALEHTNTNIAAEKHSTDASVLGDVRADQVLDWLLPHALGAASWPTLQVYERPLLSGFRILED